MAKPKRNRGKTKVNRRYRKNPGLRMRRNKVSHHGVKHHRRRRGNPGLRRHHRRRNPGMEGIGPMVTNAVFVIVGALGSKLGAQAVLGTSNVGIVGYAANAAVGLVLWFLTDKVMKSKVAAQGILAGTLVQIILRIINDYTPFGQYVSNLGMGDYQMQSFVTPQVLVDPWRNADIQIPQGWGGARALPMPSASAGPGQMQGRRGGGGPVTSAAAAASPTSAPAASSTASGMSGVNLYGGGGGSTLYG